MMQPDISSFPPVSDPAERASTRLFFADADIDDKKYGNLTLTMQLQGKQTGNIFFNQTIPTVLYWQGSNEEGHTILSLWGKISEINELMQYAFFDASSTFVGYAPMQVFINDLGNYGQEHCIMSETEQCRDYTFTCQTIPCPRSTILPMPDLCVPSTERFCVQWMSRFNRPHFLFPNQIGTSRTVVDVSVGATRACDVSRVLRPPPRVHSPV